jgi:hypothetical protein
MVCPQTIFQRGLISKSPARAALIVLGPPRLDKKAGVEFIEGEPGVRLRKKSNLNDPNR